jgi:hypothetical protein
VSFRDDDGSVGGITYHDQLYETELPATPAPAAQTPIYYSAPVVDYVPMYVPVAPPPAVIPAAPPPPAAAIAPPPASKPAKRDFGTTRGTPGKR